MNNRGSTMNHSSINTQNNPLIKSWFGFSIGAISVGISLIALFETFNLVNILSTLGFLCFWYPWSQMTHWNNPIKNFFKVDDQAMTKPCIYLTLVATVLLIISAVIRFIT